MIVLLAEGQRRLHVGGLSLIELAKIGIGQTDVVEHRRRPVSHAEGFVAAEAPLKRLESFGNIPTNACDCAEILIDHGHRFGILDGFRSASRLSVHRLRAIEIATGLVHDGHYVQRLGDSRWRAGLCRSGDRGLEHVDRGAAISLLQIDASEPAKRAQPRLLTGERIANQALVTLRRIAPSFSPLGLLGFLDESPYLWRFQLPGGWSGTDGHDEARMVRRADPSSRSFLARVGREMP